MTREMLKEQNVLDHADANLLSQREIARIARRRNGFANLVRPPIRKGGGVEQPEREITGAHPMDSRRMPASHRCPLRYAARGIGRLPSGWTSRISSAPSPVATLPSRAITPGMRRQGGPSARPVRA